MGVISFLKVAFNLLNKRIDRINKNGCNSRFSHVLDVWVGAFRVIQFETLVAGLWEMTECVNPIFCQLLRQWPVDVMRGCVPAASGSNTSALCRCSSLKHTWFSITHSVFSLEAIHHFYRTSVLYDAIEQEEISDIFIESLPASPLFLFYYGDCHQWKFGIFTNSFYCFAISKPRTWIENSHQDQSGCILFNLFLFLYICFTKRRTHITDTQQLLFDRL